VPLDDSLNEGEADSCAFKFAGTVETLENPEQFVQVFHIEADAVVSDEVHRLIILGITTRFNPPIVPGFGELDGVGKKIDAHLLDEARDRSSIVRFTHRSGWGFLLFLRNLDQLADIEVRFFYVFSAYPGEIQLIRIPFWSEYRAGDFVCQWKFGGNLAVKWR
jgi:hypothetical protein